MKKILLALATISLLTLSCSTSFTGDAHVPGGPRGCDAQCRAWGLEFVGMIAIGEYSDGCICRRPGVQMSRADVAGAEAAVAGVWTQMKRAEEQQQQSHR